MSRVQIALYKGPKSNAKMIEHIFHWAVVLRSLKKHSHCEIVVDGICYSSSSTDGGVRSKKIDLTTGRWDVIDLPVADAEYAIKEFKKCETFSYDWTGVARFVLPFLKQKPNQMFCSEICAKMLGIPDGFKLFPGDFKSISRTYQNLL